MHLKLLNEELIKNICLLNKLFIVFLFQFPLSWTAANTDTRKFLQVFRPDFSVCSS